MFDEWVPHSGLGAVASLARRLQGHENSRGDRDTQGPGLGGHFTEYLLE